MAVSLTFVSNFSLLISQLSDPTVGVDFFARIIEVKGGTRIKLQLWDTGNLISFWNTRNHHFIQCNYSLFSVSFIYAAGQERFRSITKSYYRNSVGVLLVYDITNHASFEHIPLWMMEAKRHIEPHRPVFALTGCKLDLVSNGARREVSRWVFHAVFRLMTVIAKHILNWMNSFSMISSNARKKVMKLKRLQSKMVCFS